MLGRRDPDPVAQRGLDQLVYDSAKGTFTAADGGGDVIKHVTNSNNGTGTYNTDYWTLTETNGDVYEFGRNELPGWATGKPTTNSVDTTQVYSAHSGDPCYKSTFATSGCTTAYRWHLDYVKDVHGNAMAYYYKQDTNKYGADNSSTRSPTSATRTWTTSTTASPTATPTAPCPTRSC
ncbi:hypothetical protein GXW82_11965 [Streptacidiphilus sp. 4-A2]|nr:hypothetical protein [Streptacidiphilus sp. 4-A2]